MCYNIVCCRKTHRGIAQLVEYRSPKPWVAGSNPPAPAKTKRTAKAVLLVLIENVTDRTHSRPHGGLETVCAKVKSEICIPDAQTRVLNPSAEYFN